MRLSRGTDAASSAAIGLAISAALFAGAFLMVNAMVEKPTGVDTRASSYEAQAITALEVMVRETGQTTNGQPWSIDADRLTRFGMSLHNQPNFIDYAKVRALRNGTLHTDYANKAPDYPEVRDALGFKDVDFHLRTYPVLPGLDDPRWVKDPNGRVAYFAHYSGGAAPVNITAGATKTSTLLNVSITLANKGLSDAVYQATVELADPAGRGDKLSEDRHTGLIRPGESQTIWVKFDRLPSWDSDFKSVHVKVIDPYGKVAIDENGVTVGDFWLSQTPPAGGSNAYNLLVEAGARYYVTGDAVRFHVDHYDGNGAHVNNAQARFVLRGPNNVEWLNQTISLPKPPNQVYTYDCPNCTMVGNYTAVVWDTGLTRRYLEHVHVSAAKMFTEKKVISTVAAQEMSILESLHSRFDRTRYDATTAPQGDVFGDDSNGPNELADVLSRYTIVIIGSEVAQTSLNSATTKYALRDWVSAGGLLIVLGTKDQESNWLEPIYHAAQTNANGGISAPDPTHPVLVTPNRLAYDRYLDRGRAWDVDKDQPFTHVLNRGTNGNSVQDTLTLSNPGAVGNGTVVLTSYMPGSITDPNDFQEGRKLLHNLMSQAFTMLFLDYGPPIPEGVQVGSGQRLVAVPHPNVPGAVVEVKLVMYVFG